METTVHRIDLPLNASQLQTRWTDLNARFFGSRLPPITIEWSRRLTSSVGLFSSRMGPRVKVPSLSSASAPRRLIRLSLPLLGRLASRIPSVEQEILNTLAHEMIHQWQYDVLKRCPDHGLDFLRKMTEMNRSGCVGITRYHELDEQVRALSRYRWRCRECGLNYHRRRRTLQVGRHRCGVCRGRLEEVASCPEAGTSADLHEPFRQLSLAFTPDRIGRVPHRGKASRQPPSTGIMAPVVLDELSEARNSTASPTSRAITGTFRRFRFAQ